MTATLYRLETPSPICHWQPRRAGRSTATRFSGPPCKPASSTTPPPPVISISMARSTLYCDCAPAVRRGVADLRDRVARRAGPNGKRDRAARGRGRTRDLDRWRRHTRHRRRDGLRSPAAATEPLSSRPATWTRPHSRRCWRDSLEDISPSAAAVADGTLVVVVARLEGANALRAVEDALDRVDVRME